MEKENYLPEYVRENFKRAQEAFVFFREGEKKNDTEQTQKYRQEIFELLWENMRFYVNSARKKMNVSYLRVNEIEELYLDQILGALKNYQPEKAELEHYFQVCWNRCRRDFFDDKETPIDFESWEVLGPELLEQVNENWCTEEVVYEAMLEVGACLYQLSQRRQKRNAYGYEDFRIFFTETVAMVARETTLETFDFRHEMQLFDTMQIGFLDFFMREKCRSLLRIHDTSLHTYEEKNIQVRESKRKEEITFPFEAAVYQKYFEDELYQVLAENTHSRKKSAYKKLLRPTKEWFYRVHSNK